MDKWIIGAYEISPVTKSCDQGKCHHIITNITSGKQQLLEGKYICYILQKEGYIVDDHFNKFVFDDEEKEHLRLRFYPTQEEKVEQKKHDDEEFMKRLIHEDDKKAFNAQLYYYKASSYIERKKQHALQK